MSHPFYNNLWAGAQKDLQQIVFADTQIKKRGLIKTEIEAKWLISHLYISYVHAVNKLDQCYDQIVHPQKREVLSRLLDTCLGRVLEIRRDIVRLELDDYNYFDDILIELKLTREDITVKVPQRYWRDREKDVAHRRSLIQKVFDEIKLQQFRVKYLKKVPDSEKERVWAKYLAEREAERLEKERQEELLRKRGFEPLPQVEVVEEGPTEKDRIVEAIRIIQRHERARRGRLRLPAVKYKRFLKRTGVKPRKVPASEAYRAAAAIQRHWRRHRRRVLEARRLERELILLGMLQPSWTDKTRFQKVQEVLKIRRKAQDVNQKEWEKALVTIKDKMTQLYAAGMAEDIIDEIRVWFQWFFTQSNFLPDYPPTGPVLPTGETYGWPKGITQEFVDKNFPQPPMKALPSSPAGLELAGINTVEGSGLVATGQWINPQQFVVCQEEVERLKKNKTKAEKPKKMGKAELAELKKKEEEEERKREEAEELLGFQMKATNFLAPLCRADRDYRVHWMNLDESKNYDQKFVTDLVKDQACYELSLEVRKAVDEVMRLELNVLKNALERDKNPKKKQKNKPPKKEKPPKEKKKKDPTGHRTLDELFIELYKNGIIKQYEEAHLKDYIGEPSYTAYEHRAMGEDPVPCLGDVKDVVLQLCILPLGSSRVHQLSPLIKSICLIGPENGGKEFLARIVCTETASVMFDLTPANLVGKYPGKDGLKMLQHLVEKMSRALQPSVIFIDGAEKPFYKRVPKPEKYTDPKRLKGVLPKLIKGIKEEDQVLVLGVCSFPGLCPPKALLKNFDRFIFVPLPDYGTLFTLWQSLLTPFHCIPRDFDFSCLARVSKGYSVRVVMDMVKEVMTAERVGRCCVRPCRPQEFMEILCKLEPTPDQIQNKILSFLSKTPIGRKKKKRLEEAQVPKGKTK